MKIADIHEVTITYFVSEVVLTQVVNDEYFRQQVENQHMKEDSFYIAVSKSFLELAEKIRPVFSERPYKYVFSYKDADNYKHIMSI